MVERYSEGPEQIYTAGAELLLTKPVHHPDQGMFLY